MGRDLDTFQTLSWIGALAASCAGMTAFAFTTFVAKTEYEVRRNEGQSRLVRIEEKLDHLIERVYDRPSELGRKPARARDR